MTTHSVRSQPTMLPSPAHPRGSLCCVVTTFAAVSGATGGEFVRLPHREMNWAPVPIRHGAGIAAWRPGWVCPGCAEEVRLDSLSIPDKAGSPCGSCGAVLRWVFRPRSRTCELELHRRVCPAIRHNQRQSSRPNRQGQNLDRSQCPTTPPPRLVRMRPAPEIAVPWPLTHGCMFLCSTPPGWLRAVAFVCCRQRQTPGASKPTRVAPPQPACPSNGARMHAARLGVAAQGTRVREPWPTAVRRPRPPGRTCRQLPGRSQPVLQRHATASSGYVWRRLRFAACSRRVARDTIGLWMRAARPRNGRDQGGVNGRLGTLPQGQSIRQYLDAAAISKGNVDVHVPQEDVGRNSRTGFAADSRRGPLQGCPACSENAGRRTSCTVVTQGIECTSTPAPPWSDWHGQSQASEQHNAETTSSGVGNSGAVGSAVRAREPPGPAWDSINAREAGSRSERRLVQAEASQAGRGGSLPSSQRALQGCAQQAQEAGARQRQVHPTYANPASCSRVAAFASPARSGVVSSGPSRLADCTRRRTSAHNTRVTLVQDWQSICPRCPVCCISAFLGTAQSQASELQG